MKNIKYLLILILCAGLVGGAMNVAAQTGSDLVLAAGKKPLRQSEVDKLIEFYEWAFDSEFSIDERVKFQAYTVNEFRNDPTTSRATIDDIVQTLPRILSVAADVQAETKKNFLAVFLPEARKNTDENSLMLLEIYEKARNGGRKINRNDANNREVGANVNTANAPTKTRGGNAGGLNGKWFRSTGSGMIDYTGKTKYKSGETFNFEFLADGTVIYTSELDVLSIMQCTVKGANKARGTYTVVGDSLTINLGVMSSVKSNSCDSKENFNKTLEPSSTTVKFNIRKMESIARPDNPLMLCFDGADDDSCFERVKQ